jgi:hypothetical protein
MTRDSVTYEPGIARSHVDLCAGRGGWQAATGDDPTWRTVGIDIAPIDGVDVLADVRQLPLDCQPDLLTMSPPCTEFARWMLPWCDEPNPDLSLVKACLQAVDHLEPRWWVMENSRGLHQYWRPARTHIGPYYLWGEFPPIDVVADGLRGKMQTSGERPDKRAEIPRPISRALKQSVETFGGGARAV